MKSVSLPLAFLAMAFSVLANAAPVTARYLRFDGYYSSNAGQIDIYEIEAYVNHTNVARTATVTANSATNSTSYLIDGNITGTIFTTDRTNPGPASELTPHWIQLDLGSIQPVDRIKVYLTWHLVSFDLFLSNDGVSWTQIGRNNQVSGMIQNYSSAPVVTIQSATMRPGTTLMDVVYRVTDPDDATVKTRALAFVDGVRSFAKVIRPVTFVEGTAAKLGDAIPANVDHTLTWDVAADWDVDLGQVKFDVLAMDGRGLLPFDWITIPAVGESPQTTVSKNSPSNNEVLKALFWRYADGDTGLTLENGILSGNSNSGVFNQVVLANGSTLQTYSTPFIFKQMNLDTDDGVVATTARAGLINPQGWHAANRAYTGTQIIMGWGQNSSGQTTTPVGLTSVITAIAAGGSVSFALKSDGTLVAWGTANYGQTTIPAGLSDVAAVAAGGQHSLALKNDGTVVGWGDNSIGQTTIPAGLSGVAAIAAGNHYSLALRSDGTVVAWGANYDGQATIPAGLNGVVAIAAGGFHGLALKNDGTVVGWGDNDYGQRTIPAGLSDVAAIAAGGFHGLALKNDGTVVGWGDNTYGQTTIPAGLSGVATIAAGFYHSLALRSDGTVVAWGQFSDGTNSFPMIIPVGLNGVTAIAAGSGHSLVFRAKAP